MNTDVAKFRVTLSMIGIKAQRLGITSIFKRGTNGARNIVGTVKCFPAGFVCQQTESIAQILPQEESRRRIVNVNSVNVNRVNRHIRAVKFTRKAAHVPDRTRHSRIRQAKVISVRNTYMLEANLNGDSAGNPNQAFVARYTANIIGDGHQRRVSYAKTVGCA